MSTEEQIKHNAERYANSYEIRGTSDGEFSYMDKKDAYIAGAHSRDEEKPSNQWISVKDRLPKKKDGKIRSDVVLVTLGQSWTVSEYHFGDKRWINLLDERETIEPEYWQEVNLPEEVL